MKVLGIGEVVIDRTHNLNQYPKEGIKITPSKISYSLGGPVPVALILLSRLGHDCSFVATIGTDDTGAKIKNRLKKENITFLPHYGKASKMNLVLINSQNGSRTIVKDTTKHPPIQNLSRRLIRSADLIIFDRHEKKAFDEVIRHKKTSTKIIVDPSSEVSGKTIQMCSQSDYPILPIESLRKFRRHENLTRNLQEAYQTFHKPLIVTLGEKGSLIYDGRKPQLIPAFQIKTVDTNGAGDIYRGAFGYGLLQNWDLVKCVRFANRVSALQCAKPGNDTAIPQKQEIEDFARKAVYKKITIKDVLQ